MLHELFSGLDSSQSLIVLSWLLIAFLLGLLAGHLLRDRYAKQLAVQLDAKEAELKNAKASLEAAEANLAHKDAEMKRAQADEQAARSAVLRLEDEKKLGTLELDTAKVGLEKSKYELGVQNQTIVDLQKEVDKLKAEASVAPVATDIAHNDDAREILAAIEAQLSSLTQENTALRENLQQLMASGGGKRGGKAKTEPVPTSSPTPVVEEAQPETPNLGKDNTSLLEADKARLIHFDKDELSAIQGVGPFLEKKLNEQGIFTYGQVAAWTEADIDSVTKAINFFDGRIAKDNWVGQAKELAAKKAAPPAEFAANSSAEDLLDVDTRDLSFELAEDLKIIFGVDEEVEKILQNAGVDSYAELAKMEPDGLRNMLEVINPALSSKDPSTWPAQARLALDKEWEALLDYQDQIKAGEA
jgi:predicted flap endonuclease-1-like 5' DNA nuclease